MTGVQTCGLPMCWYQGNNILLSECCRLGSLSTRKNEGVGPGMIFLLLYNIGMLTECFNWACDIDVTCPIEALYNIGMLTECFNWACNVDITHSDSIKHYVRAIGQGAGALSIFGN